MKLRLVCIVFFLLLTNGMFAQITAKVVDGDYPLEYATATLFLTKEKKCLLEQ